MTLTEFLLARIAEDEAVAPTIDCPCGETPTHPLPHCGARVLAECDAKRRIVGMRQRADGIYSVSTIVAAQDDGFRQALDESLRLLALPYADHPDYNPAWSA